MFDWLAYRKDGKEHDSIKLKKRKRKKKKKERNKGKIKLVIFEVGFKPMNPLVKEADFVPDPGEPSLAAAKQQLKKLEAIGGALDFP